jgi:5-methylcytosine-specific restriction enzyme A
MGTILRRCLSCGELTPRTRCNSCETEHDAPRRAVYDSARYRRMRTRVIRRWIADHGPWCPGYRVPGHVAHSLTLDHRVPLAEGGDPYDEANAGVLCRECNARKRDALT